MTPDERRLAERRTVALRGPGAGGLHIPQSLAASNPCLNCGTNVQLEFCPECGQRTIDPDPTLREFLHELAQEFVHWDGKLVTTFRQLLTQPGALTLEYLGGKRIRYISPLRLYFACSLLYFFVSAIVPGPPPLTLGASAKPGTINTQLGPIGIQQTDSTAALAALDTLAKHGRWVGLVWGKHFANALRNRAATPGRVAEAIPKAMFVLVPLFAALVMLVFRQSRRRFPQHLAFALHMHAFIFLILAVMLVRRFTTLLPVHVVIPLLGFIAMAVYLVQSTRTVYGGSMGSAIAKSALVSVLYFALFCVVLFLTFGLVVLLQF